MSRSTINFFLDTTLLFVYCILAGTSSVVRFVFPPGPEAAGWRLWGYGYQAWCTARFVCLAVLSFGVLMHLTLHWNWVCGFVASRLSRNRSQAVVLDEGSRTLYGVGLLIAVVTLLGAVVGLAVVMIQPASP